MSGDDTDENDNPGGHPSTDAGDLGDRNAPEADARQDYEESVGSETHQQELETAREEAGFDDPPATEE